MRWYGHISRFKAMRMHNKRERKMLLWALSLKPGDVISGCHKWPYNVVVEKVGEVYARTWRQLELSVRKKRRVDPRGWILDGVEIFTADGYRHECDGTGNCVTYPLTVQEIRNAVLSTSEEQLIEYLDNMVAKGWFTAEKKEIQLEEYRRAKAGLPICDERGVRL